MRLDRAWHASSPRVSTPGGGRDDGESLLASGSTPVPGLPASEDEISSVAVAVHGGGLPGHSGGTAPRISPGFLPCPRVWPGHQTTAARQRDSRPSRYAVRAASQAGNPVATI